MAITVGQGPKELLQGMPKLLPNTQMTQEMLGQVHTLLKKLTATSLFMSAQVLKSTEKRETVGTSAKIYLFVLVLCLSMPMAESGQEGD